MSRITRLLAALLLLPLQLPAAEDPPADERAAAYTRFRAAFDARDYATALPLAVRVVELTANQYGEEAVELVNPLTNLPTTLYRLGQHGEALDTYRRALTILELSARPADARLRARGRSRGQPPENFLRLSPKGLKERHDVQRDHPGRP